VPNIKPAESGVALSIVTPCYNEQAGLGAFYERACRTAAAFCDDFELVLVDDGSHDATWTVIETLVARDPRVVGVKLSRNHGHQTALTAGLSAACGALVLVIDADLQDPPEHLSEMHALMLREGADVVYGKRRSRAGETAFKRQTAALFYRTLAYLTSVEIPVDAGDFRLMTRRVSDLVVAMPERDRFVRGMVAWLGFKQVPFEYDRAMRAAGATSYSLRRMVSLALDAFVGFSMVPLRLAGWISLGLFAALTVGVFYTLFSWLLFDAVRGWTSLTMLIILVSAVQLWSLSIIGEYVGRIYLQSKARPLFIIDTVKRHAAAGTGP
jgi:polyisoprenyl-phosphate glycosyltransferase